MQQNNLFLFYLSFKTLLLDNFKYVYFPKTQPKHHEFKNDWSENLKDDGTGVFTCVIWSVRDRYPIALHIECEAYTLSNDEKWHNANLGIDTEETTKDTVRKSLRDIVEEFAVFFLKAKGVL